MQSVVFHKKPYALSVLLCIEQISMEQKRGLLSRPLDLLLSLLLLGAAAFCVFRGLVSEKNKK